MSKEGAQEKSGTATDLRAGGLPRALARPRNVGGWGLLVLPAPQAFEELLMMIYAELHVNKKMVGVSAGRGATDWPARRLLWCGSDARQRL